MPTFSHFDQGVADMMARANDSDQGLPGFLAIKFTRFAAGELTAVVEVRRDLLNPFGALHGGVIAGLVDHCLGCVLYPLMQRGQWAATTEFKLNYLAAVRGGTLQADANVLSFTKRTAVVRVDVSNENRLACVAQGTVLIVDPPAKDKKE